MVLLISMLFHLTIVNPNPIIHCLSFKENKRNHHPKMCYPHFAIPELTDLSLQMILNFF